MPKFELGDALAKALKNVPESDTAGGPEEIRHIDLELIDNDGNNFYSLDGIDALAANIELVGLQQPLRVRRNPAFLGRYILISGHRRRAALGILASEGQKRFQTVPCIVEDAAGSAALQELKLIYANSDTRKMSDADLSRQAERVETLLYQLKEEGFEFPGRMRDHVAEACKVSKTKLATLKVIREKLPDQYQLAFAEGSISTEAAYQIARAPAEMQERICKAFKEAPTAKQVAQLEKHRTEAGLDWKIDLTCPDGKPCTHGAAFLRHDANTMWEQCGGKTCCLECRRARENCMSCGFACAKAKAKRSELVSERRTEKEKERERERKKVLRKVAKSAKRLIPAIDRAGLADQTKTAVSCYISGKRPAYFTIGDIRAAAEGKFAEGWDPHWDPFAFEPSATEVEMAKLLGCSFDFLYGRCDDPAPGGRVKWIPGDRPPETDCDAVCVFGVGDGNDLTQVSTWFNGKWHFGAKNRIGATIDAECLRWFPLPEEQEAEQ